MGGRTPCVTAIRALRMQKDQLQVGHTIHPSDSGRQASERPPCFHKESAAAYPLRNLAAREPVEPEYPAVVIPVLTQHYAMCSVTCSTPALPAASGLSFWLGRRRPSPSRCATSRAGGVGRNWASGCVPARSSHGRSTWRFEGGPTKALTSIGETYDFPAAHQSIIRLAKSDR